ncbi:DJ-1 [Cantharellus anzutake]|uniref:DJ-1 n=1 Tax=Cantharellus anzutake TaxID=1750568 RepID=UPI0019054447|nr:DJ-1 [Cantharellus anzutake]KAF8327232.1 DJ-1 [Cantharellus anzutake]
MGRPCGCAMATMTNSKSALVLIADGTEEIELYDALVRAGIKVTSAYVGPPGNTFANCSRGVRIVPDVRFDDVNDPLSYDALLIPGGAKGAETLSNNAKVQELVRTFISKKNIVGMICAGTLTALNAKLARQPLTSHPSVKSELENEFEYSEESVVVSGTLVTSRGPGTAFPFALKIIDMLAGEEKRKEVEAPMMFPPRS